MENNSQSNSAGTTVTLRVPRPNIQVIILGLVAFITLFQTVQLVRVSSKIGATPVKAAIVTTTNTTSGPSGGADVPEAMVGGC